MEITRIVRLSFQKDKIESFVEIFNQSKDKIRHFEGCVGLELHSDFELSNVYYTHSKWISNEALENYRNSDLFKTTWSQTKILFDAKPMAFSLLREQQVF